MKFEVRPHGLMLCAWAIMTAHASAAEADGAQVPGPTAALAAPAPRVLVSGSPVVIALDEEVSSKSRKDGETFRIHLAQPIERDGVVVVPAGASGVGEVIHASKAGMGGKPGVLIIAARYLTYRDVRIPLGHLRWSEAGKNNAAAAIAVGAVTAGIPGLLITGTEVKAIAGSTAAARLTADVAIPANTPDESPVNGEPKP